MSSSIASPTDFVPAIQTCLAKFATFRGRAGRGEFWWFQLFFVLLLLVAGILEGDRTDVVSSAVTLVFLLPELAVTSRRLHDRGMSAGWLALHLLPAFGMLALLAMCIPEGETGPNEHGPEPV